MSLFEVKGWDVPSKAVAVDSPSQSSRKRKRPTNDSHKVQSAQVNLEKLMRKVEKDGLEPAQGSSKKRRDRKGNRKDKQPTKSDSSIDRGTSVLPKDSQKVKGGTATTLPTEAKNPADGSTRPSKRARKKKNQDHSADPPIPLPKQHIPPGSTSKKKASVQTAASGGLTSLQSSMKGSLDGARFRWINEVLYTTSSGEGHKLMREDPNLYGEYHTGFRQQVRSWPSNPITHYIQKLSSYPRGTLVADLGCGDAALARSLVPKGYGVLSFDLVSDGVFVLEADVCERIPLPGSEELQAEGQIVDVCVCALSLMSLDWIKCIRETWRILRIGGELMIAEVTSRFTDVDQFVTIISSLGFKFKSKDESNTHFTLFEFEKVARESLNDDKWEMLREKHTILKPCEYKRR